MKLLTNDNKENIIKWEYNFSDTSISSFLLTPFWEYLLKFIPLTIAPNLLTLSGFYCLLLSAYYTFYQYDTYPIIITFLNMVLFFLYQTLDALDGKQARKIQNASPLGELLDHTCDNIGMIFTIFTICWSFQLRSPSILWLILGTGELIFFLVHLMAYNTNIVKFSRYMGPGEIECLCIILLPLNLLNLPIFEYYIHFIIICFYSIASLLVVREATKLSKDTFNIIVFIVSFKFLEYLWCLYYNSFNYLTVFTLGLYWSIIISDIIVSKMAKKQLNPLLMTFTFFSFIDNILILTFAVYYFTTIFIDLCNYLDIPMFTVYNQKKTV